MLGLIPRWPIEGVAIPISQLLHPLKIPGVEATVGMHLMSIFTYAVIKKGVYQRKWDPPTIGKWSSPVHYFNNYLKIYTNRAACTD